MDFTGVFAGTTVDLGVVVADLGVVDAPTLGVVAEFLGVVAADLDGAGAVVDEVLTAGISARVRLHDELRTSGRHRCGL